MPMGVQNMALLKNDRSLVVHMFFIVSTMDSSDSPPITSRTRQEQLEVQSFVELLKERWEKTHYNREGKELSMATFPFTPEERQSLQRRQRQGWFEGALAGLAAFTILRKGPGIMMSALGFQETSVGAQNSSSPFAVPKIPTNSITKNPRFIWVEAIMSIAEVAISFHIARTAAKRFAPPGDATLEAIVGMPALPEQPHQPSVLVNQVCPMAIDLYQEMTTTERGDHNNTHISMDTPTNGNHGENNHRRREETPVLARKPPKIYELDVLQRFVRNCQRRRRVEQTTAWKERNVVSN